MNLQKALLDLLYRTGAYNFFTTGWEGYSRLIMIAIGLVLIYLAIVKKFEPLLLLPIGFGGILANIPIAEIAALPVMELLENVKVHIPDLEPFLATIVDNTGRPEGVGFIGGFLGQIYSFGIKTGLFPLLIFMGVGAMTDFGPLIANPKTALLGAAAQFGIFTSLVGAIALSYVFVGLASAENIPLALKTFFESMQFTLKDAGAIGIIGGADGPTAIFLASRLSPNLLGAIAVSAYSYMALVPIIQPPIMKLFTSKQERMIEMKQLRHVSKREKVIFPIIVLALCIFLLPDATPLIGALMFGNLVKECGVVERLSKTVQNELINIVTILLGLGVGSKLAAEKFLNGRTLLILALGLLAFCIGTMSGVLLAKLMNLFLPKDKKINPLIGAAGVSAVPMAARVANKVGLESNPHNFLLMHAMGPNVSGVIGSAVAAGVLLSILG